MTASPLVLMIRAARAELRAETPTAIHTHHAPKLADADGMATHYPDEGGIGLPFTASFHRLLSMGEGSRPEYLLRASLEEVADWCASRHAPHHDRPGGTPLCGALVDAAIRDWLEPREVALFFALPEASARSLLINALAHAAQWRATQRKEADAAIDLAADRQRIRAESTPEDRLRAEHDPDQERVWESLRTKYSGMASWSEEIERRRQRHKAMRCEGCPLIEAA